MHYMLQSMVDVRANRTIGNNVGTSSPLKETGHETMKPDCLIPFLWSVRYAGELIGRYLILALRLSWPSVLATF
jgi:hypothetical protein